VALLSYGAVKLVSPLLACDGLVSALPTADIIEPLYILSLPLPINAVHALLAAIAIGLLLTIGQITFFDHVIFKAKRLIEKILTYGFIPFLPLYILGFLLKIRHEGVLACLMQQYGSAFLLIVSLQYFYLIWLFFFASGFSLSGAMRAIKNALPSYITAFSTMSSAAAIPVSVENAEKNTGNKELAQVAMPIMANVHLLGDSFGTPILVLVTMLVFQGIIPELWQYLVFVFYFCVTMFAASGVPGGGILVMIPILKSQLGFTSEMVSIVMTIYFLLDSFGTGANVMGDGALVIIVNKILKRVGLA
jgi:Na+/H+-dicarboxylate symporter